MSQQWATGSQPRVTSLTAAQIAALLVQFPKGIGLTGDQYAAWLVSAVNANTVTVADPNVWG